MRSGGSCARPRYSQITHPAVKPERRYCLPQRTKRRPCPLAEMRQRHRCKSAALRVAAPQHHFPKPCHHRHRQPGLGGDPAERPHRRPPHRPAPVSGGVDKRLRCPGPVGPELAERLRGVPPHSPVRVAQPVRQLRDQHRDPGVSAPSAPSAAAAAPDSRSVVAAGVDAVKGNGGAAFDGWVWVGERPDQDIRGTRYKLANLAKGGKGHHSVPPDAHVVVVEARGNKGLVW